MSSEIYRYTGSSQLAYTPSICHSKRLQEEADAAKAYRDFVASFDDPSESNGARGHKAFVRAGGSGRFLRTAIAVVCNKMLTLLCSLLLQARLALRLQQVHLMPAKVSDHLVHLARDHHLHMVTRQLRQRARVLSTVELLLPRHACVYR